MAGVEVSAQRIPACLSTNPRLNGTQMDFSRFNAAEQAQLNRVIEKKQESSSLTMLEVSP